MKQLTIRERLVPFKARILAAVPGKSLNNRIYTRELLQQSAPFYDGRPFILDHDIEHAERVVGIFSHPRYATERGMDNRPYEGLWLDAVGLMDEDLFEKVKGSGLVPPLVRGFSIGGAGEGDFQADGGILIKSFIPAEGSVTAFPGIPAAHIAAINAFRESFRRQNQEVKKTSIPVKETHVSLEEAEKQAAKLKEGPIPDQDMGAGTRQRNDVRPGLPSPARGKPVRHQQPQATTSADTGVSLDGGTNAAPQAPMASTGSKGPSNEIGPSGTSPDAKTTPAGPQTSLSRGSSAAGNMSATPQLAGYVHPPGGGRDVPPAGTSGPLAKYDIADEPPTSQGPQSEADNPVQDHPGQSCDDAHAGQSHDDYMGSEEGEEEESVRFRIRQDDEPVGVTKDMQPIAHPGEEEEEEKETGDENPILKTAKQRANPNPHREENLPSDVMPIQARAYSLPVDTGIFQAAMRFDKLRNADRTKEAQEYIAAWDKAKKPPEQPLRKVRVRPAKGNFAESTTAAQNSLIRTIEPTMSPRDQTLMKPKPTSSTQPVQDPSSVPTRSITNTAPAPAPMYASSAVTTLTATAAEILEKVRKEPFGMYNLAGRAWRKMLPELLDVR